MVTIPVRCSINISMSLPVCLEVQVVFNLGVVFLRKLFFLSKGYSGGYTFLFMSKKPMAVIWKSANTRQKSVFDCFTEL